MRVALSLFALAGLGACSTLAELDQGLLPMGTAAQVESAGGVAFLPLLTWQLVTNLHACSVEGSCPGLVETEEGLLLEGGCVDEDGWAWQGAAWLGLGPEGGLVSVDFQGFGYEGIGGGLVVDGSQSAEGEELLATEGLELRWWGAGPLGIPDHLQRVEEQVARFQHLELVADDDGLWSVSALALVEDAGAFTVDGSGWFDEDQPHGELILEGEQAAELVMDGLSEGCMPWSEGGVEVCPW